MLDNRWPPAHRPCPEGCLRETALDFRVEEVCDVDFADRGEHLYLDVERSNRTTPDVQALLARAFGVPRIDVGYAGMKDKRAVARQWFSVRAPANPDAEIEDQAIRILERRWHTRKLRRGELTGNRFVIHVTGLNGHIDARAVRSRGFPNYFGPQRFGHDGGNINAALAWAEAGRGKISRFKRSIYISTLRSILFNDLLAARVQDDTWHRPIDGDVVEHGIATGALWGRGRSPTRAAAAEYETQTIARHEVAAHALEFCGTRQDRRPLVAKPVDLEVEHAPGRARLSFGLPKGSYATSLLAELVRT